VRILHLNGSAFDALAAGDLTAANAASPVVLSDYFAGPDWRSLWRMRSEQARQDPSCVAWVTGVIWDEDRHLAVGCAGFHAPPDTEGMVEIGYAVVPIHRRHGYARAAVEMLLERARGEPAVRKVRVTIAPENSASQDLAAQYGFTAVGRAVGRRRWPGNHLRSQRQPFLTAAPRDDQGRRDLTEELLVATARPGRGSSISERPDEHDQGQHRDAAQRRAWSPRCGLMSAATSSWRPNRSSGPSARRNCW
jgi:RimJ/RimL family protein N-acetyltransferase